MKFWENRRLSCALMVLMIIVATGFGSYRTLKAMRDETIAVFYKGVDNDGYGIQKDLDTIVNQATKFIGMASLYAKNEDAVLVREASAALNNLSYATGIHEKYQAKAVLMEKVSALYYVLENYDLSKINSSERTGLYRDMISANEIIGHNEYNAYADRFNETLHRFPANVLSKLTLITEAEAFR